MANVAIRTALAEAYLGDTKVAKTLFADPATFDQRLVALLDGLGQADETILPGAISGDDLKAFLATFHATSNTDRIAKVQDLLNRNSAFMDPFQVDDGSALTESVLGVGLLPFKDNFLSPYGIAPDASIWIRRFPGRGGIFDFDVPFVNPYPAIPSLTGHPFKFMVNMSDLDTFLLPFSDTLRPRPWIPCSLVRTARSETNPIPGFYVQPLMESVSGTPTLTFTVRTSAGTYLNWSDIWTNGSFAPVVGAVARLSFSFTAM